MANVGAVTATTANTQLLAANVNRMAVLIKNPATNSDTIFLNFGTASATTAASMPLAVGESMFLTSLVGQIRASTIPDAVQVLANSGSQVVNFIEF